MIELSGVGDIPNIGVDVGDLCRISRGRKVIIGNVTPLDTENLSLCVEFERSWFFGDAAGYD
jgi:hypothetical protein